MRDDFLRGRRALPVGQGIIAEPPVESAGERGFALLAMRLGLQQPRHLLAKQVAVARVTEIAQIEQGAHQLGESQQLRLIGRRRLGRRRSRRWGWGRAGDGVWGGVGAISLGSSGVVGPSPIVSGSIQAKSSTSAPIRASPARQRATKAAMT